MIIDAIPEPLLWEILDYLHLDDRLKLFMTCKLFRNMQAAWDRLVRYLQTSAWVHHSIVLQHAHKWENLLELDLTRFATNPLLLTLTAPLTRLKMVGSTELTNNGLADFSHELNTNRPTTLQYMDLTYCSGTTYSGTFPLRDAFAGLVIRRQPDWMDGHFVTPFDNDGLHTYWCDGSFQFQREQQSCGHVSELFQQSEDFGGHVGDKLQYTNFVPPPGWPDWSRYCYRPGVSLFKLDQVGEERSIMVGQCLYGIRPPKEYPKPEHVDLVPLHSSRYFDRHGNLLEKGHNPDERHVMVSRMKVLPLESPMPPREVVEQNREFLAGLPMDLYLERGEEFLHHALNRE
jgi:hypothetical protein